MHKGTHFIGQPVLGQLISLLDKPKILEFSKNIGGERYVKKFDAWQHMVIMLYAIIKRFDSLREITDSMFPEARKLSHLGVKVIFLMVSLSMNRHPPLILYPMKKFLFIFLSCLLFQQLTAQTIVKFDNGPDYVSDGLFRIVGKNSKIGFADTCGAIVIPPVFSYATPFHNGEAKVAFGGKNEKQGEYQSWKSNLWFLIKKSK